MNKRLLLCICTTLIILGCLGCARENNNENKNASETQAFSEMKKETSAYENVTFSTDVTISEVNIEGKTISLIFSNNSDNIICYGPDEYAIEIYDDGWKKYNRMDIEQRKELFQLEKGKSISRSHSVTEPVFPELKSGRYRIIEEFCYGNDPRGEKAYACAEFTI
ncbi:MAG: hypothetical protein II688_01470 [Lachnospiraceae bacterium]|nr:hypothetical protein [Lachnospiraceae bacterium]